MTPRRWCVIAVVALGALSACSGDDGDDAGTQTTTVSSAAASATTATTVPGSVAPTTVKPATVISVAVEPGTATGFEGALTDVAGLECTSDGATWTATGTVTNSTTGPVDYRIYVSLLDATNDTRGLLQVDVNDVEAGEATPWSGSLALAEPDLTCVLRVERTAE